MWETTGWNHKKCDSFTSSSLSLSLLFFCEFVPRYEEVMVEIYPILARLPSPKPLILVSGHRFDYEYGATMG